MSEFTNKRQKRISELQELFYKIAEKRNPAEAVKQSQTLINNAVPSDIIGLADKLMQAKMPINDLKSGMNKFLNIMYDSIQNYPYESPKSGSFLNICILNNKQLEADLKELRPLIKEYNKIPENQILKNQLTAKFKNLLNFTSYYTIKENVLFPVLEKQWNEHRCVALMWSYHDDIRSDLKAIISVLETKNPDLKQFNKLTGTIFFNMNAVKFREERILFPEISNTIKEQTLDNLLNEALEMRFPYYMPETQKKSKETETTENQPDINLKTGSLNAEQLILLFNHLPVDITYVDENNKVLYFSTPKKRIFPRTISVIGRDVHNCHPPESVHIVEKIVEAFRNGSKDKAEFWIQMRGEFILIRYFALRDDAGKYKGVIEVSQEVSDIKNLKGEQRLLDWDDES